MMAPLPNVHSIQEATAEERAGILDTLFEPCTQLHTLSVSLLREKAFVSYDELIEAVRQQMHTLLQSASTSDTEWLDGILSAHPRLGEGQVASEQSRAEQAQLQSEGTNKSSLATLNHEYENQFQGLRFV